MKSNYLFFGGTPLLQVLCIEFKPWVVFSEYYDPKGWLWEKDLPGGEQWQIFRWDQNTNRFRYIYSEYKADFPGWMKKWGISPEDVGYQNEGQEAYRLPGSVRLICSINSAKNVITSKKRNMDELMISVENNDYTVQLQEENGHMLYIVKAGDADIVFSANDLGDIAPRDEANPPELLLQIGRAIENALT